MMGNFCVTGSGSPTSNDHLAMKCKRGNKSHSKEVVQFTIQKQQLRQRRRIPVLNKDSFIMQGTLGRGGFGSVMTGRLNYRKHSGLSFSWFAIKEMKKRKILATKRGCEMLQGELTALKRLDHDFIVQIHFAFTSTTSCYLGLDLLLGSDLRYYLMQGKIFDEKEVAFLTVCLASAIIYMHSKGIIHRDIKPENIILDERGYPHITDFGVAHVQESFHNENSDLDLTSDSNKMMPLICTLSSGTKQYLAPEVFTKSHLHSYHVDFWSLGVMLYELIYACRPFAKACPVEMVHFLEAFPNNYLIDDRDKSQYNSDHSYRGILGKQKHKYNVQNEETKIFTPFTTSESTTPISSRSPTHSPTHPRAQCGE